MSHTAAPFLPTEGDGQFFTNTSAAADRLAEIHQAGMKYLVSEYEAAFETLKNGGTLPRAIVAYYPELRFTVHEVGGVDPSLSHGFVDRPGVYATSITRPVMYRRYLIEQMDKLLASHGGEIEIRVSHQPIPLRMCRGYDAAADRIAARLRDGASGAGHVGASASEKSGSGAGAGITAADIATVDRLFTPIDSACIDDTTADGEADFLNLPIKPLSLFSAQRIDLALQRLEHYTGAHAANIQQFVLFTNYQLHTDVFLEYAASLTPGNSQGYTELVCPGELRFKVGEVPAPAECRRHAHGSQMPAYHLVRDDGLGISIVDIGVGPSNAKTITDCLAVTRPHCWMMVGHCAGLDGRMRIGDMILANGYDRADGVLDDIVPLEKPIPPIAEIQMAVTAAFADVSGLDGDELRKRLRTGTVLSTSDRNWEWKAQSEIYRDLQKSTAIGVEMESATIATNGYRFRVPYGALLSVSDMPLHNQPKLPKSAKAFYQSSKVEHLMAAVRACERLAENPTHLHSRKLRRPVGEVAFR